MSALLVRLVRSIEDELRVRLAVSFPESPYPELNAALTASIRSSAIYAQMHRTSEK